MIEVRVFATLREGRDKITMMDAAGITCAGDIIAKLDIPPEEVPSCSSMAFTRNQNLQ